MAEEIQQWKLNVEMFARLSDSFMFQQIYSQQNISILLGPNNLHSTISNLSVFLLRRENLCLHNNVCLIII